MADDDVDFDNPRDVELSSLSAIYPEIQQLQPDDPYAIALDVPVHPSKAVTVYFPATAADDNAPVAPGLAPPPLAQGAAGAVDSHELAYLPSVHLEITLGPHYPAEQPPRVVISTTPPWIPDGTIKRLEEDAARLWEEMGRDIVGFTYIDHVQQAADGLFGLVDGKGSLEVDPRHKIAILDYDIQARKAAFEKESFDCGVCLEPKKGSVCHRMLDCGHVFCVACLQDFYNSAIKEGDITAVKCLTPDCAKDRAKGTKSSGRKRKKPRTFINPSELLQIPLDQETVKRYVTLKYKVELESDKNTIYCPRQWCNGAARSKKHKKPQGLSLAETSDDSASDDEDDDNADRPEGEVGSKPYKPNDELLAICEECAFAFCSRCHQSWHGEFFRCIPRRDKQELTADELASLEYMRLHSTPCPTCGVPAQKTHGCNHMICSRCQSHFCYLCSSWLDPGNPYQHFNEAPDGRITGCYMRLWELEEGDGDGVGHGFAGGVGGGGAVAAPRVVAIEDLIPVIEEPDDDLEVIPVAPQPEPPINGAQQVGIAREGPLVLRIAANQPAAAGRGGPRGRQGQPAVGGGVVPPAVPQAPGPARGGPAVRGPRAAAQRGQRNRGRGGGNAGPAQRQDRNHHLNNNNNHNNQLPINNNNNNHNNNLGGRPLVRPRHADPQNAAGDDDDAGGGDVGLAPAHEEWVRHFVQLALNDMEGESDDEEF